MRKTIVVCDKCGSEGAGNVIQLQRIDQADMRADLCDSCSTQLTEHLSLYTLEAERQRLSKDLTGVRESLRQIDRVLKPSQEKSAKSSAKLKQASTTSVQSVLEAMREDPNATYTHRSLATKTGMSDSTVSLALSQLTATNRVRKIGRLPKQGEGQIGQAPMGYKLMVFDES